MVPYSAILTCQSSLIQILIFCVANLKFHIEKNFFVYCSLLHHCEVHMLGFCVILLVLTYFVIKLIIVF